MKKNDLGPCSGKSYNGWRWVPCPFRAKVTRDGEAYCGRHDPVAVKARKAAEQIKVDERLKAQQKHWGEQAQMYRAWEILKMINVESPLAGLNGLLEASGSELRVQE